MPWGSDRTKLVKPPTPVAAHGDARESQGSTKPSQTAISTSSGSIAFSRRTKSEEPWQPPSDLPRTAVYGSVRTVVWEDRVRKDPVLPDIELP